MKSCRSRNGNAAAVERISISRKYLVGEEMKVEDVSWKVSAEEGGEGGSMADKSFAKKNTLIREAS